MEVTNIKTYMQSGSKVRIRMVSLMRIQNIFLSKNSNGSNRILISKESGKQKYKQLVSDAAWKQLNSRYQNLHCSFTKDSVLIAGYYCKKANIQLADGKQITAYFTNALPPADKNIEPMFACLPGMVLKYEYKHGNGTLIYHAVKVKHNPISETVFREPGNEYPFKKAGD
mgnify:CR=1 FL=1